MITIKAPGVDPGVDLAFGDSAKVGFFAKGREFEPVTTNHQYTELERKNFFQNEISSVKFVVGGEKFCQKFD